MTADANISTINYSDYSEAQLFAALNEIQAQKASLDSREKQIRAILHSIPNEETRSILENDEIDGVWDSHDDFLKSLENSE